ncbi:transposase [Microdochium nivale]|nr:transposase [Microdochium nivale]
MPPDRTSGVGVGAGKKKPHHSAQTKETFLYALRLIKDLDLPVSQRALARHAGIPESTARRFISESERAEEAAAAGEPHMGPPVENRGRRALLSPDEVERIERLLYEGGHEVRKLPFDELPPLVGIDFKGHKRTMARLVGQKDWRRCIAPGCERGWTHKDYAEARYTASKEALAARSTPESWRDVRWADEAHFTFGGEGGDKMTRREGEQECPDCLVKQAAATAAASGDSEGGSSNTRGKKQPARLHCWAAVGHDFKSDLVWYTSVGSISQAITQNAYMDDVLTKTVKRWIRKGDKFVLEEDIARKHVLNQSVVKQWAEVYKLKCHASSTRSPDLSPIEDVWRAVREHLKTHIVWDEETLREAAKEAWEAVSQERINEWVASMPQRHRDVMNAGGYLKCDDPNRPPVQIPPIQPKRVRNRHSEPQRTQPGMPSSAVGNATSGMPVVATMPVPNNMHHHQALPMPGVYHQLDHQHHQHPLHQLYTSTHFMQ